MAREQENIYTPFSTTKRVLTMDWEVPAQSRRLYYGSMLFADIGAILSRAELIGKLPPPGEPAVVLANHLKEKDAVEKNIAQYRFKEQY